MEILVEVLVEVLVLVEMLKPTAPWIRYLVTAADHLL